MRNLVSKNLVQTMDKKGMTTRDIASATGLTEMSIRNYCSHDYAGAKLKTVVVLAKALQVRVADLIEEV